MRRLIVVRPCSIIDSGADLVVNASNDTATLGGGVSRALFDECGGELLQQEMKNVLDEEFDGVLDEGDCMVTSAGSSSRFRYILHVPAADYRGTRARLAGFGVKKTVSSPERIQTCTEASLRAAAALSTEGVRSVAFPLLGAGSGGLSVTVVCHSMIAGVRDFFERSPDAAIDLVVFAVPEPDRFAVCSRLVQSAFG